MISIQLDDPRAPDITALLQSHLAFVNQHSAPEDVHALDVDALCGADVLFFAARKTGDLLAIGALRKLTDEHVELKSMHTTEAGRGHGLGRAMVEHLLSQARGLGVARVSLETGTMDAMAPARALYLSSGFVPCEPFGDYFAAEASVCMTLELD